VCVCVGGGVGVCVCVCGRMCVCVCGVCGKEGGDITFIRGFLLCTAELAVCVYTLYISATYCSTLQHTATHCNTPIVCDVVCAQATDLTKHAFDETVVCTHLLYYCNILQCTATPCNTLQHTAIHCNTLQHTATHCIRPFVFDMVCANAMYLKKYASHEAVVCTHACTHTPAHTHVVDHFVEHVDDLNSEICKNYTLPANWYPPTN